LSAYAHTKGAITAGRRKIFWRQNYRVDVQ
jgi:hypothetical protein